MSTRTLIVNGIRTVLREAGPRGDSEAVVFVHGNPGSSADYTGLLERVGGFCRAVAWDAPGFGRADKPDDFPQSIAGHSAFIGAALDTLGVERAHIVLHDFGAPWGLHWAAHDPDRFASAVLINGGLLLGYHWHTLARIWQTRGLGELFMATMNRPLFRASMRQGNPRPLPRAFVDRMYDDLDRDTRRAILRLYRTEARPQKLANELAAKLRPLNRPALVLWGKHDIYLPVEIARRQREAFPEATLTFLENSGHWPLADDPDSCEPPVTEFLQRMVRVA